MLIATYHGIAPARSPVTCTRAELEADLARLRDAGFHFTTLARCRSWLDGAITLPARTVALTFDDGYASVASEALPLLHRHGVPATIFAIAGRIGLDNQWPGQWKSVPRLPLMDRAALRDAVSAGWSIGAHTWSHPVTTQLSDADARTEIIDAAAALEDVIGCPVMEFAYPYGVRGRREIALARERFTLAVNATPRIVERTMDPLDLPRLDCHDLRVALSLRLATGPVLAPYLTARRIIRAARA